MASEVVRLIKQRDAETLKRVFDEVNPYLLGIIYNNRIYGEQAEDILQNAWLTFFENIDKFREQSQLKVFIAGIVFNKIREHRRSLKRHIYEEDAEKIVEQSFLEDGHWRHQFDTPEKLMHSKQFVSHLEECMEGLSESQREAFSMREILGEKTEDICNILNISVSNLGVLLFRAKDKLRQCIEGRELGPE